MTKRVLLSRRYPPKGRPQHSDPRPALSIEPPEIKPPAAGAFCYPVGKATRNAADEALGPVRPLYKHCSFSVLLYNVHRFCVLPPIAGSLFCSEHTS